MPSEEYCAQLLEDENDALDEAQDALDAYNEALDDMEVAAAEAGGSWVKAGAHGLGGDWSDSAGDVVDGVTGGMSFSAARNKVDRAKANWDRKEQKRADKMRKWCDECGSPPDDDSDDAPAEEIDFSDDESEPIIGHPGGALPLTPNP